MGPPRRDARTLCGYGRGGDDGGGSGDGGGGHAGAGLGGDGLMAAVAEVVTGRVVTPAAICGHAYFPAVPTLGPRPMFTCRALFLSKPDRCPYTATCSATTFKALHRGGVDTPRDNLASC